MDRIPPLAWAAIALIVIITIGFNYSLISMLRNKPDIKNIKPPKSRAAETLQKAGEVLRNPFGDEQAQLKELSDLVDRLNDNPPPPDSQP